MKKILYIISTVLVLSAFIPERVNAQAGEKTESLRDRLARRQKQQDEKKNKATRVPRLSVRAEMKNQSQMKDISTAAWMREIYRIVDLDKGPNAALMFPMEPVEGRMNLFTMIFKLMAQGDLEAYEYQDGREVFTKEFKIDFKDVLERLDIPFEKNGEEFIFNEMDVPNNEVTSYYVKEAWFFDKNNSVLDTRVIALCPILDRMDDMGIPSAKYPQFWVPYENIKPYAARMPIMTSDYNNAMNKTIDDYFVLRLYDGEIYKTTNMANKVLLQMYENEDSLKAAQKRIEQELITFEEGLWVLNDSIQMEDGKYKIVKGTNKGNTKKVKASSAKSSKSKSKVKASKPKKQKMPKAPKAPKSSSGLSARDRRSL